MIELINEEEALNKAYNSLIKSMEDGLEKAIDDYNLQMIKDASIKINDDLINNGSDLGINPVEPKNIQVLEDIVNQYQKKLEAIKSSKERLIKR